MKKLFIVTMLFIFSVFTSSTLLSADEKPLYCSDEYWGPLTDEQVEICTNYDLSGGINGVDLVEVYEGEFVTSEGTYNRIEYDSETEKWHGVAIIEEYLIHDDGWADTFIDIKFSRDLERLSMIEVMYTTESECDFLGGVTIFGACLGDMYYSEIFHEILFDTRVDGSWAEDFLGDEIQQWYLYNHGGPSYTGIIYDYIIYLQKIDPERQIAVLAFLEFEFTLTDEEIIQLGLDIQSQYNYEVYWIQNNDNLNITEKNIELGNLNDEYNAIPDLNFDMVFAQVCDPDVDNCIVVTEPSDQVISSDTVDLGNSLIDPDLPYWEQLIQLLGKGAMLIIGGIAATSIVGVIAFVLVRKSIETTGEIGFTIGKGTVKTGAKFGTGVANGILTIFEIIGRGFTRVIGIFKRK